jgi:hypothetical protein
VCLYHEALSKPVEALTKPVVSADVSYFNAHTWLIALGLSQTRMPHSLCRT